MTIAYDPTSGNRYPMNRSNPSVTFPMLHYDLATSNLRMKASAYQRQTTGLFSENNTPTMIHIETFVSFWHSLLSTHILLTPYRPLIHHLALLCTAFDVIMEQPPFLAAPTCISSDSGTLTDKTLYEVLA
ncbi:hypothetical protein N7444_013198 [Penicillium canescens]|nr:hypothetical protein N7444_013198 [Penicillium canescens]